LFVSLLEIWLFGESGVKHLVRTMVWRGDVLLNSNFFLSVMKRDFFSTALSTRNSISSAEELDEITDL
jgi:hypothetical protein